MNKQILKLFTKACRHADYEHQNVPRELVEKFAELIVRECIKEISQQMYWHRIDQSNNPNFYKAVEKTLKHFGFEE